MINSYIIELILRSFRKVHDMAGIKSTLIILVIIVGIAGIVSIKNKDNNGIVLTGYIVALIAALAAVLAIPLPPGPDSGTGVATSPSPKIESTSSPSPKIESTTSPNPIIESTASPSPITESLTSNEDIEQIIDCKAEVDVDGYVKVYDTFTDFNDNEHNDVIYMGHDGAPSSIVIHVNGNYTNIRFDFYAVSGMSPIELAYLEYTADDDPKSLHGYGAIPKYNESGSFYEDITGKNEVKITFHGYGTPYEGYPCAVLIDDIILS